MDTPAPQPKDPREAVLDEARAAIAKKDWTRAQGLLRDAVAGNPQT